MSEDSEKLIRSVICQCIKKLFLFLEEPGIIVSIFLPSLRQTESAFFCDMESDF